MSIEFSPRKGEGQMTLLRTHIGQTLRQARIAQSRTLRDVAKQARVSLGYLSEVERGQKEASSELLNAICLALNLSLSTVLIEVTSLIKLQESPVLTVVDTNAA
jgi:transcriptional regulator with XRE-family HTH domain